MARRVDDFQTSSTQIKDISIFVQAIHLTVERFKSFDIEFRGRFFGKGIFNQPTTNFRGVAFGTIFNPIALRNMRGKPFEQMIASSMIPMSVGGNNIYW